MRRLLTESLAMSCVVAYCIASGCGASSLLAQESAQLRTEVGSEEAPAPAELVISPDRSSLTGLMAIGDDELRLLEQFRSRLYPLFQHADTGCIDCHQSQSTSALVLTGNVEADFWTLLDGGYFEQQGPDTLLGRLRSENDARRMPKEAEPWADESLEVVDILAQSVGQLEQHHGIRYDERFPRSLLQQFHNSDARPSGKLRSGQFLSYRQLRGKIDAIFDDQWVRDGKDLFAENVAMFGGADFRTRFNESRVASAAYFTALQRLARDVGLQAARYRTGPFRDLLEGDFSIPAASDDSTAFDAKIETLYERILFRAPTFSERQAAAELLRRVNRQRAVELRDHVMEFELTASDPLTGDHSIEQVRLNVRGDRLHLTQQFVDQRSGKNSFAKKLVGLVQPLVTRFFSREKRPSPDILDAKIGEAFLVTEDEDPVAASNQRLLLHNVGTHHNVSFAGVELRSNDGTVAYRFGLDDPTVQFEGAWVRNDDDGLVSMDDGNQLKGESFVTVGLAVEQSQVYSVHLLWRASPKNSGAVLVELFTNDGEDRLAMANEQASAVADSESLGAKDPQFFYDCGQDAVAFATLPGTYRFDEDSFVEISNRSTLDVVSAAAIELVDSADPDHRILIDSELAEGNEAWERFDAGRFKAYNVKGTKLHDNGQHKGELFLRYLVGSQEELRDGSDYEVRIYYPAKRGHDTRVPVRVHAKSSSPLIDVARPRLTKAGATTTLDASASRNVQGTDLLLQWRQVSGPPIEIPEPNSAILSFETPRVNATYMAWGALAAALVRHPDFLFTEPAAPQTLNETDARRSTLAKLAVDLLGRAPKKLELQWLEQNRSWDWIVDQLLETEEFRGYYFHRIRLYLESQGGEVQDEPARLWTYIALNDRPFQELLTADYTVDTDMQRIDRPSEHHGTGILTTKGFIQGKPGLPHYNYAAQVSMLFLGYVYEVPPEIVEQREGVTALGTTDPNSACYSCHKVLTPLAFQRLNWTDDGEYRTLDESGLAIDATDRGAAKDYPFAGEGMRAFARAAVKKERFIRTIISTHTSFYLGRPLEYQGEDRKLYRELWDNVHKNQFKLKALIKAIVCSEAYMGHLTPTSSVAQQDQGSDNFQ